MTQEELQKLGEKIAAQQATQEETSLYFSEINGALSDIQSILLAKKK